MAADALAFSRDSLSPHSGCLGSQVIKEADIAKIIGELTEDQRSVAWRDQERTENGKGTMGVADSGSDWMLTARAISFPLPVRACVCTATPR